MPKVFQFFGNNFNDGPGTSIPGYIAFMPRQRLDPDTIARIAMAVVDDGGLEALSLSAVAQRLDVGPSALYSPCRRARRPLRASRPRRDAQHGREGPKGGHRRLRAPTRCNRSGTPTGTSPAPIRASSAPPWRPQRPPATNWPQPTTSCWRCSRSCTGAPAWIPRAPCEPPAAPRSAIHGFVALEASTGTTPAHDDHYGELIDLVNRAFEI